MLTLLGDRYLFMNGIAFSSKALWQRECVLFLGFEQETQQPFWNFMCCEFFMDGSVVGFDCAWLFESKTAGARTYYSPLKTTNG